VHPSAVAAQPVDQGFLTALQAGWATGVQGEAGLRGGRRAAGGRAAAQQPAAPHARAPGPSTELSAPPRPLAAPRGGALAQMRSRLRPPAGSALGPKEEAGKSRRAKASAADRPVALVPRYVDFTGAHAPRSAERPLGRVYQRAVCLRLGDFLASFISVCIFHVRAPHQPKAGHSHAQGIDQCAQGGVYMLRRCMVSRAGVLAAAAADSGTADFCFGCRTCMSRTRPRC
jgi:hypothetical protein